MQTFQIDFFRSVISNTHVFLWRDSAFLLSMINGIVLFIKRSEWVGRGLLQGLRDPCYSFGSALAARCLGHSWLQRQLRLQKVPPGQRPEEEGKKRGKGVGSQGCTLFAGKQQIS